MQNTNITVILQAHLNINKEKEKMYLLLKRHYKPTGTWGTLTITEKNFSCNTLELPNLFNTTKVSCIPEGIYKLTTHTS